jgi:hypothetical protein
MYFIRPWMDREQCEATERLTKRKNNPPPAKTVQ